MTEQNYIEKNVTLEQVISAENNQDKDLYVGFVSKESNYPSNEKIEERPIYANNRFYVPEAKKDPQNSFLQTFQGYNKIAYDHIGASYWILEKLSRESAYIKHALHIASASCASTTPLFQIIHNNNKMSSLRDELTDLLLHPNRYDYGYSMIYKTVFSIMSYGNSYWQVIKKKNGDIHSIYFLPSNTIRVIPFINTDTGILENCYIQMDQYLQRVEKVYFDDEIIHFKNPNKDSILYGVSDIVSLFKDISFDEESKNWLISWFQESFSGGTIFKMPNSNKDVVKRNRQEMVEKYTGSSNAGRIMVLEGDMAMVYDGNKAREIDLKELRNISRDTVYTCFGIPLSIAGVRSKEGSGNAEIINSEEKAMLRNTVNHYLNIVYKTLDIQLFRNILNRRDLSIKSGVTNMFTNVNASTIITTGSKYCGNSINENREIAGLPPIQDSTKDYYDQPIIATNNGIAPLEAVFGLVEGSIIPDSNNQSREALNGQVTPTLQNSTEKGQIKLK